MPFCAIRSTLASLKGAAMVDRLAGPMIHLPTRTTNRDMERHYFERFRKVYTLPHGAVCYADKPDVLVKGNRTIGIEITKFYLQPGSAEGSEQRQRQRRDDVVSEAHKLYRAARGKGIELTIQFNPAKPITSASKKTLPMKLAEFAARVDTQPSGPFYGDSFPEMPEITSIWLNSREWADAKWNRPGQVYSVEAMSPSGLEKIVKEKESKAADYAPCDAYWLLIVVDWIDPAQEQEIMIGGLKLASAVFEKIIVYKPNFEDILEVKS
jgi:hypothetical protein